MQRGANDAGRMVPRQDEGGGVGEASREFRNE